MSCSFVGGIKHGEGSMEIGRVQSVIVQDPPYARWFDGLAAKTGQAKADLIARGLALVAEEEGHGAPGASHGQAEVRGEAEAIAGDVNVDNLIPMPVWKSRRHHWRRWGAGPSVIRFRAPPLAPGAHATLHTRAGQGRLPETQQKAHPDYGGSYTAFRELRDAYERASARRARTDRAGWIARRTQIVPVGA